MYKNLQFLGQLACVPRALFLGMAFFACFAAACTARDVVIGARGTQAPETPAQPPAVAAAAPQAGEMAIPTMTTPMTSTPDASMPDMRVDAAVGGARPMSPGCTKPLTNEDNRVATGGGMGSYLLDLPSQYDNRQPVALLIAFRSGEIPLESFRDSLNLGAVAGQNAIVVYPESLGGPPGPPPGPPGPWSMSNDLPFFDDRVAQLLDRYCVDPSRVYVVGYAMGGYLASTIACSRGDVVRGAALFAGAPPVGPCIGNVAMFLAQGDMDPVYPLRAGRMTRDFWTRRNHCDASNFTPAAPAPCVDYGACSDETPVRYCEYSGGHELPSFAANAIWDFFSGLR